MPTSNPPSWHAIVHFGTYGPVDRTPPHGPYRSRELAEAALARFIGRLGQHGGSYLAATSIRVVGPFPTRAVARAATISNYPQYIKALRKKHMTKTTITVVLGENFDAVGAGDDWIALATKDLQLREELQAASEDWWRDHVGDAIRAAVADWCPGCTVHLRPGDTLGTRVFIDDDDDETDSRAYRFEDDVLDAVRDAEERVYERFFDEGVPAILTRFGVTDQP